MDITHGYAHGHIHGHIHGYIHAINAYGLEIWHQEASLSGNLTHASPLNIAAGLVDDALTP